MLKFYPRLLTVIAFLCTVLVAKAQVSLYSFTQSAGTYTPITGGTVVAKATGVSGSTGLDDVSFAVASGTIPFAFNFNGTAYTGFYVSTNGSIAFGSDPGSNSSPISSSAANSGAIAPMAADLRGVYATTLTRTSGSNTLTTTNSTSGISIGDVVSGTGIPAGTTVTAITATSVTLSANATSSGSTTINFGSGEIRYETIGTAPNRIFVIQFKNFQRYSTTNSLLNFQIRLSEGGGVASNQNIEFVYGNILPTSTTFQVGLRGATNSDYNNRTTTTDWMASTAGSSNSSTMTLSSTVFPASGTTFTWTPPTFCSGQPIGGTSSATPATACYGGTVMLSTTGTTSGEAGLSYQWQSAPLLSSTWTDIPGATSLTYSPAILTSQQYRLVVTCSASGLNDVSSPTTVNVGQVPSYASYPFSESFENWINGCNTNDRPGVNWGASPVTGNNSWRRDDEGVTMGGWTNTNGAYSPLFTSGAHSARFHSYYAPDGSKGILDLFIDLSNPSTSKMLGFDYINTSGTDQLKVYLSTDGGNTFTQVGTTLGTQSAWGNKVFAINSNSATSVIRLEATSDYGTTDIGVDNLVLADACSGTPVGGTTIAPLPACMGGNLTLGLTGNSTEIGIGYQWQSSPDGTTWTDISGAIQSSYTLSNVTTGGMQYRAVLTCSNNGLTANSTPLTVTVASPPYATTPYVQNFENWVNGCGTNDRPGINWAGLPVSGNNSWRRDDQGSSASWTSTSGGYSPAFSEGAHSARFHSWSAANGAQGTLDLYIDLSDPSPSKDLSFDYINTSGTDVLKVFLSTDGGASFTQVGANLGTQSAWANKQFVINSTSATSVIRLQATSDNGSTDIGVDNLKVLIPCTGTPSGGSTSTTATLPACIGTNVTLNLTGATVSGGLTYQWQSSPDGLTWTDISGATGTSYTVMVMPGSSQYRATITCTNSGISASSTPLTLTVSIPTYASLPYSQGFENWISVCATNDRPDASWALIPVMSDSAWRRDDQGSSAGWGSTSGAYSPVFSQGAHSARFHSWGAPSGKRGSMDLYIDLSTSLNDKLLKFDYINSVGTDSLTILLSTDGGLNFTRLDSITKRTSWSQKQVVISSNSATAVIRFRATSDFGSGAADIGIDNVQIVEGCTGTPAAGTITVSGNPVCSGGSAALGLSGQTVTSGITYQWQSSPDNTTWTDISGATASQYSASPTTATWYRVIVTCTNTSQSATAASVQINVNSPTITSSTDATRCGIGTLDLQATGSAGTTVQWYTAATGGTLVGTGTTFTTPEINTTTTYYAQASLIGSSFNVGLTSDVAGNLFSYSGYGMYFSSASNVNINSVNIYPSTAGTINVQLKNASGTVVDTRSFTITSGEISKTVPKTLALNFNIPAGASGWQIYYNLSIYRGEGTYTYPSTANGFSITGNTLDGNNITNGTRYYFYDWNISSNCSGPRVAVNANINPAPAIIMLPASVSICEGQSTPLTVNSSNPGYTYTWNPGAQTGSSISVSPITTTKYILTAVDNSGGASNGCVNRDSVTVTVTALPAVFTVTPSSAALCTGEVATLTTGTTNVSGTITGTSPSASTATSSPFYRLYEGSRKQYLIRASELSSMGLVPGSSLNSISINVPNAPSSPVNLDNLKVKIGATANTTLTAFETSPTTLVYSSASFSPVNGANVLNFLVPYAWDGTSNLFVELCFDNDVNNTCSAGSPTCWGNTPDVTMATAPFASTVVRYADNTSGPRDMCSDNTVSTTTSLRPVMTFTYVNPATWSPAAGLYTDAAATIPYVTGNGLSTVYAKPTVATTYTATITNSGGCTRTATASVTINTPPAISVQPLQQIGCTNGCVTLNVGATGTGLTYQWKKNGADITGATNATLSLCNLTAADAGNYSVVVSGTCPSPVTSNTVAVAVGDDSWVGISNSDWNNPLNWCGGVPTPTTNVLIPAGTPFAPIITANSNANNLQINSGATVTINASGRLMLYGNLANNGILSATSGSIEFRGANNQTVPAISAANIIMNGAGGITLGGNMNVGTALTLFNGNITLGNNNLVMTGGSTGSLASHIITNGTGKVTVNNIAVATAVFPVSPNAASYNPVMIANGQGKNYTVGVVTGVTPSILNNAKAVNRTWNITSSAAVTTPVSITLQYADADANGVPTDRMEAGVYNGTSWITITPAGGIAPTGTAAGRMVAFQSTTFGPMVLANIGGLTFPTAVGNVDADVTSIQLMPNLVQDNTVMRVNLRRSMKIGWSVIDARGRTVMVFDRQMLAGQTDIRLKLGHLAAGVYQIMGQTDKGKTTTVRFVKQ